MRPTLCDAVQYDFSAQPANGKKRIYLRRRDGETLRPRNSKRRSQKSKIFSVAILVCADCAHGLALRDIPRKIHFESEQKKMRAMRRVREKLSAAKYPLRRKKTEIHFRRGLRALCGMLVQLPERRDKPRPAERLANQWQLSNPKNRHR